MARSESPVAKRARREGERDRSRGKDYDRNRDRDRDSGRDRERDRHSDSRNGTDRDGGRTREREDGGRTREREDVGRTREREDGGRMRSRDESRGKIRDAEEPRSRNHDLQEKNRDKGPKSSRDEESRIIDKDEVKVEKFRKNVTFSPPKSSEKASTEEEKDGSILLMEEAQKALEAKEQAKEQAKEKASFEYSGKLAEETNKVNGVAILFTEPEEARKPTIRWRLYVFKDGKALDDPLFIHRQSCYLFGRDRKVADIPIDHPSCSKQHAVLQYRLVEKEIGGPKKVRPYLMDLGSTNKTYLNGEALEPQRYYELFEKDNIKFGNSSREYVLLHENSA